VKNRAGRAALLAGAVVAVLATAVHASADEPFRLLSAKEIRPKVIARDLTDGVHWSWYYRPDGTLISVEMGKQRSGSWKIEENKLCSTNGRKRQMECYEVWASGKNISLRYFADMPAIEAVLVSHTTP
jgi:hypothetical protein